MTICFPPIRSYQRHIHWYMRMSRSKQRKCIGNSMLLYNLNIYPWIILCIIILLEVVLMCISSEKMGSLAQLDQVKGQVKWAPRLRGHWPRRSSWSKWAPRWRLGHPEVTLEQWRHRFTLFYKGVNDDVTNDVIDVHTALQRWWRWRHTWAKGVHMGNMHEQKGFTYGQKGSHMGKRVHTWATCMGKRGSHMGKVLTVGQFHVYYIR
jgi:hypothetical protein